MPKQSAVLIADAVDKQLLGLALLSTGIIAENKAYLRGVLINRTLEEVTIDWDPNKHEFELLITDAQGKTWNFSDHRPPPKPRPPTVIPAAAEDRQQEISIQIEIEASSTIGLEFDPSASPYTFEVSLNSDVIPVSAKVTLPVRS